MECQHKFYGQKDQNFVSLYVMSSMEIIVTCFDGREIFCSGNFSLGDGGHSSLKLLDSDLESQIQKTHPDVTRTEDFQQIHILSADDIIDQICLCGSVERLIIEPNVKIKWIGAGETNLQYIRLPSFTIDKVSVIIANHFTTIEYFNELVDNRTNICLT